MRIDQWQEYVVAGSGLDNSSVERLVLGICGEAGEVAELVKKSGRPGRELNIDKLADELGDVAWYVAATAAKHGLTMTEIINRNYRKLSLRYPNQYPMSDFTEEA